MRHSPRPSSDGVVISRLRDLLSMTSETWGVRVSQKMLARATGISPKMIQTLVKPPNKQEMKLLKLAALGKLCWFFGCEIDQILTYLAPGKQETSSLPAVHMKRGHLPAPFEPLPEDQLVRTQLPSELRNMKIKEVMRLTSLSNDTITHVRNGKPAGMATATLTALCAEAQRRTTRQIRVSDVLISTLEQA